MSIEKRRKPGASVKCHTPFPQGHPCYGCPYIYRPDVPGCIMGSIPGDCAWYFYKRMCGHTDAMRPKEEISDRYFQFNGKLSEDRKKLNKGMEMLRTTIEMKGGGIYGGDSWK